MYGAVPLRRDQDDSCSSCKAAGQARPREDAAADQLHLRRHRLQRRAGDGGMPRDQAGPGLPLGRGLVRLRPLRSLPTASARPCVRRSRADRATGTPRIVTSTKAFAAKAGKLDPTETKTLLDMHLLPDPGQGAHPRLRRRSRPTRR